MNRRMFGTILGGGLAYSALPVKAALPIYNRVAYSCDGNYHDKDDYGAAPMSVALLSDAGMGGKLVHFDFNSNRLNHNNTMATQMRKSIFGDSTSAGASQRFNVAPRFYDCQFNFSGAVQNLKSEIMKSTSADRLVFCLGGPSEVLYQALQGVPNSIRQYVTAVSHSSSFNQNTGPHTFAQCTGIDKDFILNQNSRLNTQQNWSPWFWLRDSSNANNRWLYSRMRASGRADVSDSGMMYYVLYGIETATPSNYRTKLA
jgi:hypothetical protein